MFFDESLTEDKKTCMQGKAPKFDLKDGHRPLMLHKTTIFIWKFEKFYKFWG